MWTFISLVGLMLIELAVCVGELGAPSKLQRSELPLTWKLDYTTTTGKA
jgi:hypothetical protein